MNDQAWQKTDDKAEQGERGITMLKNSIVSGHVAPNDYAQHHYYEK